MLFEESGDSHTSCGQGGGCAVGKVVEVGETCGRDATPRTAFNSCGIEDICTRYSDVGAEVFDHGAHVAEAEEGSGLDGVNVGSKNRWKAVLESSDNFLTSFGVDYS